MRDGEYILCVDVPTGQWAIYKILHGSIWDDGYAVDSYHDSGIHDHSVFGTFHWEDRDDPFDEADEFAVNPEDNDHIIGYYDNPDVALMALEPILSIIEKRQTKLAVAKARRDIAIREANATYDDLNKKLTDELRVIVALCRQPDANDPVA